MQKLDPSSSYPNEMSYTINVSTRSEWAYINFDVLFEYLEEIKFPDHFFPFFKLVPSQFEYFPFDHLGFFFDYFCRSFRDNRSISTS
jgi:hypothetical protein